MEVEGFLDNVTNPMGKDEWCKEERRKNAYSSLLSLKLTHDGVVGCPLSLAMIFTWPSCTTLKEEEVKKKWEQGG